MSVLFAVTMLLLQAGPGRAAEQTTLSFGVVPQQSASKLARAWGPMLARITADTGVALRFKTAPDIPTFESRLADGEYDFAYMNPYHYTVFSTKPGYQAIAHARDKHIMGIIVTRKDAPLQDIAELSGKEMAFPSPAAFAASILTQSALSRRGIIITPRYVKSHDSVYHGIAKGLYPAGGGVIRTFNAMQAEVRDQLRILWSTEAYTPHAIAAHPRLPADIVSRVQGALLGLAQTQQGQDLLEPMKIKGWQAAQDRDWDDVRELNIHLLDPLLQD